MNKAMIAAGLSLAVALAAYLWQPGLLTARDEGRLTLYGNIDIREVQLGFRVPGRLQEMLLEEGDSVTPEQLLATLDREPFEQDLAVAEARVEEAEAQLERVSTGSRPQEIEHARAAVSEARAALDNAEQELVRQQELFAKGLNSKRSLDSATATRDQAAARLDAAREALELAVEGFRSEDIAAAAAALKAARAQREQARTRLADTRLLAPAAGVMLTRVREPGTILAVGSPVYSLSLTDKVYVRAYVDEPDLGRVVPGTIVTIRSDSSPRDYQGRVGFVSPRAEFTPKTVETPELRTDLVYRLRVVVEDADEHLRQGMPVTLTLRQSKG